MDLLEETCNLRVVSENGYISVIKPGWIWDDEKRLKSKTFQQKLSQTEV